MEQPLLCAESFESLMRKFNALPLQFRLSIFDGGHGNVKKGLQNECVCVVFVTEKDCYSCRP